MIKYKGEQKGKYGIWPTEIRLKDNNKDSRINKLENLLKKLKHKVLKI